MNLVLKKVMEFTYVLYNDEKNTNFSLKFIIPFNRGTGGKWYIYYGQRCKGAFDTKDEALKVLKNYYIEYYTDKILKGK